MSAKANSVDLSIPAGWFDNWWEPAELLAAVNAHRRKFEFFEDMRRRESKPLREAWAASQFAMVLSQDRVVFVRLEPDRFPDFALCIDAEKLSFELTEAYQEGRLRDEEYRHATARKAKGLSPVMEKFDQGEEERAAIPAIVRAIENKAKKCYSTSPNLLVYVNLFGMSDELPITNLLAVQLADRWSKNFKSCWLLWEHSIFRLWPRAAKIRER